ncbi:hypothetical protein KMU_17140 [Proteus vulgaris]|nr:hypothetical protein KMU_17140 [Proteus vulgaris]
MGKDPHTHKINAAQKIAMAFCPSILNPSGVGIKNKTSNTNKAKGIPIVFKVIFLPFCFGDDGAGLAMSSRFAVFSITDSS